MRKVQGVAFLITIGVALVSDGLAEEQRNRPANPSPPATSGSPMAWQVDAIMKGVVSQITRYYNLDETQQEYTQKLMTQRVKQFLQKHEHDVRDLMSEMWDYQLNGQIPPVEEAKDFATRAMPLLAAIHNEIIDGNMKWRDILNDEQRTKHDRDIKAIDQAFQRYDQQFQRWSKGDVRPGDFPGAVSAQPRPIMKSEDAWQYYVRRFIQDYQLDEGQQQSANSVLRQIREEANSYREAHKNEFAEIEAKYQELNQGAPKSDPDELKKAKQARHDLDAHRERLEKPITTGMFDRLKKELDGIPRADQRANFEKRHDMLKVAEKKARAAMASRIVTSQPATQVAGTKPADDKGAEKPTTKP